jgi:glycosyltransferase involved in cell wall biosynthesis
MKTHSGPAPPSLIDSPLTRTREPAGRRPRKCCSSPLGLLVGKAKLADALRTHEASGLDFVASGPVPPNPAELVQSNAMADVLCDLRALYNYVAIDAALLLPATDAALIAAKAVGAHLVVRQGRSTSGLGPMSRQLHLPRVRVLSIGVEWYRKGLDVAVEAVGELRLLGLNATLDVVGATPPESTWQRDYVAYHGYLDKSHDPDLAKLVNLYHQADVFLLPTRSDPSPMVLGEAGAYSLPIVAAQVDGVPERVADGGVLLPVGSSPLDYSTAIERLLSSAYSTYSRGSRRDYESRSDWRASADQLVATCEAVVRQGATANESRRRRST